MPIIAPCQPSAIGLERGTTNQEPGTTQMAAVEPTKPGGDSRPSAESYIGGRLLCLVGGEQIVQGFTNAPVPWPYYFGARLARRLFVCGDLAKALHNERANVIASLFGISAMTVSRWRSALGIRVPQGFPRKLSDEQVASIRARAAAGESQKSLARDFDITEVYVWMLVRNRCRNRAIGPRTRRSGHDQWSRRPLTLPSARRMARPPNT